VATQIGQENFDNGYFELKKAVMLGIKALIDLEELDINVKKGERLLPDDSSKERCIRQFNLYEACPIAMGSVLEMATKEMASNCSVTTLVLEEGSPIPKIEEEVHGGLG
jgi:hypothetical protein